MCRAYSLYQKKLYVHYTVDNSTMFIITIYNKQYLSRLQLRYRKVFDHLIFFDNVHYIIILIMRADDQTQFLLDHIYILAILISA